MRDSGNRSGGDEGSQSQALRERFDSMVRQYEGLLDSAIAQACPEHLGIQFDDIRQDACFRLWRALESGREIRHLPSYIYRIAVSAAIDAIRRVKARREEQLQEPGCTDEIPPKHFTAPPRYAPDRLAIDQEVFEKVQEALSHLAEGRRRAVGLYLEGFTIDEIAHLLEWSEPKARNTLYRGLDELRRLLRAVGIVSERN